MSGEAPGYHEWLKQHRQPIQPRDRLRRKLGPSGEVPLVWRDRPEAPKDHRVLSYRFQKCRYPHEPMPGLVFSCRKCEPCLARIAWDCVGRIQAEARYSDASVFMTYTVGGDDHYGSAAKNPKAQSLHRPDLVAANKRLRRFVEMDAQAAWLKAGRDASDFVPPSVSFFGVGEYGEQFGRPHYHQIAFLKGIKRLPGALTDVERFWWGKRDKSCPEAYGHAQSDPERTYWPWGYSQVQEFHWNHAHYVGAYINKALGHQEAWQLRMSPVRPVRPLMGVRYFESWAMQHVETGLPLRDDGYQLPPTDGYEGGLATFFMSANTKMKFAEKFVGEWRARHGQFHPWPKSAFLDRLRANDTERCRRLWVEAEKLRQDLRFQRDMNQVEVNAKLIREAELAEARSVEGQFEYEMASNGCYRF